MKWVKSSQENRGFSICPKSIHVYFSPWIPNYTKSSLLFIKTTTIAASLIFLILLISSYKFPPQVTSVIFQKCNPHHVIMWLTLLSDSQVVKTFLQFHSLFLSALFTIPSQRSLLSMLITQRSVSLLEILYHFSTLELFFFLISMAYLDAPSSKRTIKFFSSSNTKSLLCFCVSLFLTSDFLFTYACQSVDIKKYLLSK